MLKFFFNAAPNPMKIALLLEELGLPFEAVPVDTRKGEQFAPAFLAVNPNAKVPAITDGDVTVFDSNAILLYLADREQKFIPNIAQSKERGAALCLGCSSSPVASARFLASRCTFAMPPPSPKNTR
jgi:GSH-dependent disulfide-bond oxidoreductase